jgi:signal transduction histidine kinase
MYLFGFFNRVQEWINSSVHRRLIAWTTLFWLASISIIGWTILQTGQSQISEEARQRNVQLASVVSRDINAKVGSIFSDIRVFARHLELLGPDIEGQASALLSLRLSSPQRMRAVYYFESSGKPVFYLNETPENLFLLKNVTDIVSRPRIQPDQVIISTYEEALKGGTHLSEVNFTGIDRIPVFYVGVRIAPTDDSDKVVVLEVDLRDIWQRIDLSTIGQSGFTYAVSAQGIVIAHSDPGFVGRSMAAELSPLVLGHEGFTAYTDQKYGRILAAYSPVGGMTGWGIVVQQRESEVNATLVKTGVFVIGIWATLALVGTAGILILARNFTKPIVELTETTQTIARTGYLTKTTMVHQHDEIGQLSRAFDQMIEQLQTSESKVATAAADERNRLARDLHDAVTQTLFSASLIAEVLPVLWDRNQAEGRKRLEEVRQLTRGALAEMRTLLLELRPSAIVEAEMDHLLRQLAEAINGRSRVPVMVIVDGKCDLPNEVKVALYRIAQEALNNIAKHAAASNARVSLHCQEGQARLHVEDDGRGFDPESIHSDSLGLGIMRERARDIGATLTIRSRTGEGTDILAIWTNS